MADEPPTGEDVDPLTLTACKAMWFHIRMVWGVGWYSMGDTLKKAIIGERVMRYLCVIDPMKPISSVQVIHLNEQMCRFCKVEI